MKHIGKLWLCAALSVGAQGLAQAADKAGSKDHPVVSRFAGSEIRSYQVEDFAEVSFPTAVIPFQPRNLVVPASDQLTLRGKTTRILYRIPLAKTALEVMENYKSALAGAGFKTLYECSSRKACGLSHQSVVTYSDFGLMPPSFGNVDANDGNRYLVAKRSTAEGDTHVMVFAVDNPGREFNALFQIVVESAAMAQGQVSVQSADVLRKGLKADGKITVNGLLFDTGAATLKAESKPALEEMAKLLKEDSSIKVYIVGHTDNAGSLGSNESLSQDRAATVVKALQSQYGVAASRLVSRGVGPLSPVASNSNEAGRTLNRRVELVLQ